MEKDTGKPGEELEVRFAVAECWDVMREGGTHVFIRPHLLQNNAPPARLHHWFQMTPAGARELIGDLQAWLDQLTSQAQAGRAN